MNIVKATAQPGRAADDETHGPLSDDYAEQLCMQLANSGRYTSVRVEAVPQPREQDIADCVQRGECPVEYEPPKPEPVPASHICSLCGQSWDDHGDGATIETCVRVLKGQLEAVRAYANPNQIYPNFSSGQCWQW